MLGMGTIWRRTNAGECKRLKALWTARNVSRQDFCLLREAFALVDLKYWPSCPAKRWEQQDQQSEREEKKLRDFCITQQGVSCQGIEQRARAVKRCTVANPSCLVQDKQRRCGPNNKGLVTYQAARKLYATRATSTIPNGGSSSRAVSRYRSSRRRRGG